MKFWLIKPECTITLETDEPDFWKTHAAALEAMGITDLGPVVDETHSKEIARIALRQYRASAQAVAASGGNLGKKSKGRK